ncbi:MAG: nucleoside phosphorylase [Patescibacteria group bacterium]
MQPHIECQPGDIAPIVLLPGDPKRVDLIASFLDEYREVANNREFRTITGTYQGISVSVTSTGIGCPSTAIAVEELIACGATTLIRVGTCGGAWREDIAPLSVVIPTACVRDEGTTIEYVPAGFPAVADVDVVSALAASAQEQKITYFKGINRTHDSFYAPDQSAAKWGEFYLDPRFSDTPSPILSSEMETAALLIVATLKGVRAGAVLAVDASPTPLKSMALRSQYLPNVAFKNKDVSVEAQKNMIKTALGALKRLTG